MIWDQSAIWSASANTFGARCPYSRTSEFQNFTMVMMNAWAFLWLIVCLTIFITILVNFHHCFISVSSHIRFSFVYRLCFFLPGINSQTSSGKPNKARGIRIATSSSSRDSTTVSCVQFRTDYGAAVWIFTRSISADHGRTTSYAWATRIKRYFNSIHLFSRAFLITHNAKWNA